MKKMKLTSQKKKMIQKNSQIIIGVNVFMIKKYLKNCSCIKK